LPSFKIFIDNIINSNELFSDAQSKLHPCSDNILSYLYQKNKRFDKKKSMSDPTQAQVKFSFYYDAKTLTLCDISEESLVPVAADPIEEDLIIAEEKQLGNRK